MKEIKFDTLKEKAKGAVSYRLHPQSTFPGREAFLALLSAANEFPARKPREVLTEWQKKAEERIDAWDVRAVNRLVALFPEIVPKRWEGRTLRAWTNEKGDWMVSPV